MIALHVAGIVFFTFSVPNLVLTAFCLFFLIYWAVLAKTLKQKPKNAAHNPPQDAK